MDKKNQDQRQKDARKGIHPDSHYAQNKSSSKEKQPGQRQGATEEVEEMSSIRIGNPRVPKFLILVYITLGLWAFIYAFTAHPLNERVAEEVVISAEDIFVRSCAGCHGIEEAGTGPALAGVADRLSEEELHDVLYNGRGNMPALQNLGLNQQQIKVIEAYLVEL